MKILFVNEYAGFVGGVEQNIALTVKALAERGHRCHLAYRKRGKDWSRYNELFEEVHDQDSLRLKSLDPDVVYLHRVESVQPFVGQPFHTVRMVHDHDLCCPRRHKYHAFTNRICQSKAGWRCWLDLAFLEKTNNGVGLKSLFAHQRELKRNSELDKLLVGSRSMHSELLQNGFRDSQVEIVPPAVPPASWPTRPTESPNILFVGQMIKGKGPDLLLRAAAKIESPFHLTMVGEGNWVPELQQMTRDLGLEDRVTWAGWVSPEKLDEYYREARVVAVPSRWPEPFGMVGLEAMQRAKPVVGFAVGGIPDWLNDGVNGFLIDPPSVGKFAVRLDTLLRDEQMAWEMGLQGLRKAGRDFSFQSYVERLESVLSPTASRVAS